MLGVSSAESLLNTVWLNNTIHFGIRGCQEHRDLCWGDVKLCIKDAQGNEYLVYNERQTKTRSGVDASNVRKVSPKMLSTGDERDPVVALPEIRLYFHFALKITFPRAWRNEKKAQF